jgi:hypothetical protein
MCQICTLLENTWPGPKNLVRAIYELSPSGEHIEEIIDNVSRGLDEEERANLATELLKEALRMSP